MKNDVVQVYGVGTAISSIVHGEILNKGENIENATMPQRIESVIGYYENDDQWKESVIKIPVISGNSMRGIGRRMLFDHTFGVLGVTLGDLFPKAVVARQMLTLLRAGGVTSAGTSVNGVSPDKYIEIMEKVPFIDMLGMVYQGHHFDSCSKIGFLRPYLKEVSYLYRGTFHQDLLNELDPKAIGYDEFMKSGMPSVKYTKRKELGSVEAETEDEAKIIESSKEAMIYGTEYIPAGTILATTSKLIAEREGTILAFLAMYALIVESGVIGGMSGKGHGFVDFKLYKKVNNNEPELIDINEALEEYDSYLIAHRDEIIEALKSIPETFTYSIGKDKKKKN